MPRRRRSSYYDYDDDYGYYPPSRPIEVEGGIKAKTQRGTFGSSWWAKRWIEVLETFGWGNRLTRGRNYARKGQVVSINIGVGSVQAQVQGTRPTPYKVNMQVATLTDAQWEQVIDAMAQQAIFAAKLLAGEMPQDIEAAFEHVGVPLFPQKRRDIATSCSCPDSANPCKHIAAVYYLMGEQFDEDPFMMFQMRGRSREQIIEALRSRRVAASEEQQTDPFIIPAEPVPALTESIETFYHAGSGIESIQVQIAPPRVSGAILQQLGEAPARTTSNFQSLYASITAHALDRVYGEE